MSRIRAASWFETRGIASLLTMRRMSDLILRSEPKASVSKDGVVHERLA
jgi:hypothetical protein